MWQLTAGTQQLIRRLDELQRERGWFAWRRSDEEATRLLEQVAEREEAAAIPTVAAYLFAPSPPLRRVACRALHRLLSAVPTIELLYLSEVAHSWRWYISDAWEQLRPANVAALATEEDVSSSVLGLVSFHHNGYVRHEAVRLLAQICDGSELPYLLIRQNDWVSPLSADAQAAVLSRLTPANLPHFVTNLPLVIHLLSFRRHDQSGVVHDVVRLLIRPEHDALLARAVLSTNRIVRRETVRMLLAVDGEHIRRVIHRALVSEDGVIRYWAAKRIRSAFSGEFLNDLLEQLKRDRFMPVRREALLIEADLSPHSASAVWRQALLDNSSSIREVARFHLARLGETQWALVYRQALANQPGLLAALNGLVETGDRSDLPLIRSYLSDPRASRRRAATLGLAKLGGETERTQKNSDTHSFLDNFSGISVARGSARQLYR